MGGHRWLPCENTRNGKASHRGHGGHRGGLVGKAERVSLRDFGLSMWPHGYVGLGIALRFAVWCNPMRKIAINPKKRILLNQVAIRHPPKRPKVPLRPR